ncbi:MAG: apolipoprotein N-acyltransferase [Bacteroidetes bacterium]|nr:apolipoprotein N-acyltransferase [Bacteroidota bacterium]
MKKYHLLLLSLLSGLLIGLGWPERGFPGLLFIGFIPLLYIEDYIFQNRKKFIKFSFLFYSLPAFIVWNGLTTWWIFNSTGYGAILAIVLNALFMSIVVNLFHYTRKQLPGTAAGYACLVFYWMAFEFLHLNWDLNWPWLNLGNGFASWYKWVQWYEYTGTFGGTLWILLVNIFGFTLLKRYLYRSSQFAVPSSQFAVPSSGSPVTSHNSPIFLVSCWVLFLIVPIFISYIIYWNYTEDPHPVNVVIVQPNFDPYSEQYVIPPPQVVGKIMELSKPLIDSTTNFLVAPESAIQEEMWENSLGSFRSISLLKDISYKYPHLNILVGGSTYYAFRKGETIPPSARKFKDADDYYNRYNAAILLNSRDSLQLYHKSKLTPGVEIMPTFMGIPFLEKYAIDLGGIVGTLGSDRVRKVYSTVGTVPASTVICYESIFGEFFSRFVKNGAQVMFIITNDGWWGDTPGHWQHYAFASLRAIETRRSIGRSANTGISAFIDQRGDPHQETKYWEPAAIKGTINANSKLTFYVRNGDWLARVATVCGGIMLLTGIVLRFARKRKLMK